MPVVYLVAGGLDEDVEPVMVAGDGTVTAGTYPETKERDGGFTIVDVPSREAVLEWAAKIAAARRCPQEVREFQPTRTNGGSRRRDDPVAFVSLRRGSGDPGRVT